MPTIHRIITSDCLEWMKTQSDQTVDLVIGSPLYAEKGERYGGSKPWTTDDWIDWMLKVTAEAARITRNCVVWIVNGAVQGGRYLPSCEGLVWRVHSELNLICERPAIWHKNAPPSRKDWFNNDWEYCLAFRPEHSNCYF